MAPRPLVSVGDLVRVIGRLDAEAEHWPAIARLLGVEMLPADVPDAETTPTEPERSRPPREGTVPQRGPSERPAPSGPVRDHAPEPTREALPSAIRAIDDAAPAVPLWIHTTSVLDPPSADRADGQPPPPLLDPGWKRGVLEELLVTAGEDGAVDVLGAVAVLARQQGIVELPRLPHATLSRGAQVLVDVGPGMLPFAADQAALTRDLGRMAKADALEVLRFARSPLEGAGRRGRTTWRTWRPPSPPRPVLILSDLGTGPGGAPASVWRRTADVIRRAGCPAVALCPYPAERVSLAIRHRLAVVEWGRATTARGVRAAVGGRLRVSS
jgi:hypothetical protein